MKIILAGVQSLFLEGLQNLLATRGYEVMSTTWNGGEVLAKVQEFKPDVLLIDIFMREGDGLEAKRLIKAIIPECKVFLLTSDEDDESLGEAIKSGALGYLPKSLRATELFDLLASLERGQ